MQCSKDELDLFRQVLEDDFTYDKDTGHTVQTRTWSEFLIMCINTYDSRLKEINVKHAAGVLNKAEYDKVYDFVRTYRDMTEAILRHDSPVAIGTVDWKKVNEQIRKEQF